MKGFIIVDLKHGSKAIINLSNVTDFAFCNVTNKSYVGFTTDKDDICEIENTLEEIQDLIKKAT